MLLVVQCSFLYTHCCRVRSLKKERKKGGRKIECKTEVKRREKERKKRKEKRREKKDKKENDSKEHLNGSCSKSRTFRYIIIKFTRTKTRPRTF